MKILFKSVWVKLHVLETLLAFKGILPGFLYIALDHLLQALSVIDVVLVALQLGDPVIWFVLAVAYGTCVGLGRTITLLILLPRLLLRVLKLS